VHLNPAGQPRAYAVTVPSFKAGYFKVASVFVEPSAQNDPCGQIVQLLLVELAK
jgi:hypothetical protein